MLASACGPGATPVPAPEPQPAPPKPGGNQPPVISRLASSRTQVYPLDIVEIRCEASDPDGDVINYEWAATGGGFSGAGPVVPWQAPEHYGVYEVKVTIKDGKGGMAQSSITMTVTSNQNPVISSLVANPVTVLPQGRSTMTAVASDPEGDALNYIWRASEGSITGVGNTVTWIAPNMEGTYTIVVTVGDSKGGQEVRSISVVVSLTQKTAILTPVAKETGTVSGSGDKDTSRTVAGDSATNENYRAFWSFDLHGLKDTDVKDAELTFTTKNVVGDPFSKTATGLDGLHLWRVRYEPGQLPPSTISRTEYKEITSATLWEPPATVDVTSIVISIARASTDRLQLEASFLRATNGNNIADYLEWLSVTLTITYA